jgi:hypothetical protein
MHDPMKETVADFNSSVEIYRWQKHVRQGEYLEARNSGIVIWFHLMSGGEWPGNISAGLFKEFMEWGVDNKLNEVVERGCVTVQ